MSKSRRDRARFEVKRIRRQFNKLYRKGRGLSQDEIERIQLENMAQEADEDKKLSELRRQGGMSSHKNDHDKVPRREIFQFTKAFRKMMYRGEYKGEKTNKGTEITDEG